jgi:CTP synthase (UTP-ammonia lyase)
MRTARIALLGEHNPTGETHIATTDAIEHCSALLGYPISAEWISSLEIPNVPLSGYDGLWVAPGPPHLDVENSLPAITKARAMGLPVFGNCGGFQLLVVEIARNIFGLSDAHHEEYSPTAGVRVVVPLACSLRGQEGVINISGPSLAARLYRRGTTVERFYCRFGINPQYRDRFTSGSVIVSGRDDDGEIRVIELLNHPFFVGTLYVPQTLSTTEAPHPLVTGFMEACIRYRETRSELS